MADDARNSPRRDGRGAAALLAAGAVNGLAAYAFIVLGVRSFGADPFAPVAVVWSLWAIGAAGITAPLQHWAIQTIGTTGSEVPLRDRRRTLLLGAVALSVAVAVAAFLGREVLFTATDVVYPLVTGAVVLSATVAGYVRGVLGGRDRFVALAGTLVADGLLRLALLLAVVAGGIWAGGAALTVPSATLVVLCWTSTLRLDRTPAPVADAPPLGALSAGFLLLHALLNLPPVLASAAGATAAVVSSLFAAFAVFRAPFLLLSTVSTRLSFLLADRVRRGDLAWLHRLRSGVVVTVVVGTAAGWLVGGAPAHWVLDVLYGGEVTLPTSALRPIVAGSVTSLGAFVLLLLLASRGNARATLAPLGVGLGTLLGWSVLGPGATGTRVAGGFLLGQIVTLALLLLADVRAARHE